MVQGILEVEDVLGDGQKISADSERKNMAIGWKSIVAKRDIKSGEILDESNITTKRPGSGITPMR